MLNLKLCSVVILFALIIVCSGVRVLGAGAESSRLSRYDLQRAIVEGLASGRDVTAQLEAFKQQPEPRTRRASRRSSTVAGHVKTQLHLLQQALHHASQERVSVAELTALEQAYEQVQAAHLLMMAHFESVQEDLDASAAPANFERRRRDALARYSETLEALLAPLANPMIQLRHHPDRDTLIASDSFQRDLSDAMDETLARLTAQLQEPPPSILRAQTLPVRGATFAPRSPRLEPVLQPVYDQTPAPQPRPADIASAPDAPLSAEIVAQAEALDYDAVRIYEFVRNTIAVEWYAGAMKGAVGTLRQQHGNTIDQASLLIALLRASGVPARYVHGVVRLPIDAVMSSLGLTDAAQATRALTAAGVAYHPVVQGGGVAAVDIESTWVAAYVPYTNYRGTLVDASGPLWIPLMPAFKDTAVTPATAILNAMDLSTPDLERDYLSQRQATDLRHQLDQTVSAYVQANDSASTYAEQLGQRRVSPLPLDLLPSTLPVRVIAVTAEASTLDDAYRHRLRFVVRAGALDQSPIILDHTVPVADVASERLTLSYLPASVEDQRLTNRYGGLDNVPAYLIALRPQLKLNGRRLAVATGEIGVGAPYRLELHLLSPAGAEQIHQTLTAGAYHALGVTAQRVASTEMNPDDPTDTETLAAGLLNRVAVDYSTQWTRAEDEFAGLLDVALVRPWPALVLVSSHYEVETVAGQPQQLLWQGVTLDAALRASTPIARDAASEHERDWLRLSALQGSILEHQVFEELFLVESISADKGIQLAREQGITIHRIEAPSTSQTLLPSLAHSQAVLHAVAGQITLGYAVELPAAEITHESWRGSVWRATDPATGASGYFIAGGLAGGATSVHPTQWALQILRELLSSPNTPEPNLNPFGAASIVKIADTDGQTGAVADILPIPLAVIIRDAEGKPVKDASVTFTATMGGARLIALGPGSGTSKESLPQVVARTDRDGLAQVEVILGKKTHVNPIYVERLSEPDDSPPDSNAKVHLTQVDATLIEATVVGAEGHVLSIDAPFTVLAYPKSVNRLRFTKVGMVTDLDDTAQFLLTDASIRALEQQGMTPEALGYLQEIKNQVIVGEQVLLGLLQDTIGEPLTQQYKNYMISAFQQGRALVPIYTPGTAEVSIFVQAVDRYGNPVSNVEVEFASPTVAWSPPSCDDPPRYVPTHVVGRHNFDACPIDQPHFAGDCGDRLYRDTTTVVGVFVNLITALGTKKDKITIHAPKEPAVAPITFSYLLNPDMVCSTLRQCFLQKRRTTDHMGHNLHAARVGTESPYPLSFYLYCGSAKSGYTPIEAKGGVWGYINGWIEPANQPRTDFRGCWEDPGDEIHDPNDKDCIRDNPMTYQGHGLYKALITTHPSPGANDVAVVAYETQEDFDRREGGFTRLIATTIAGVAGVDLEINELISLGVPTPQRTDVIHLDEQNQTPYYVRLPYTIKPAEYWAQTVEIELFEERVEGVQDPEDDKVLRYTWTGSSRFGEGHVLIPRTTAFDASKFITAQLVLNRGAPFEIRSDYFPVPLLAKLISDAPKQLYVAHHLDLVNAHSCVQSTPFTFTLGDDARVSLVFADADNPGRVYKILDNQPFDKGTHTLPFYLPAVQALLPDDTASYALEPGTYAFALTAVNIFEDEKNRDVAVGGALFEYLPNTLPVGRTLVRDVDVSNGNLILSATDLHVPGRGVPLEFNRTYSANTSRIPGELGVGWRHNYRSRVIQDACDGVIVTGGAGNGSRFVKKNGQWQPLNGYHGTLKVDEIHDTYDFYSPDGTQYHYENVHDLGAYHLIYISDPNGNTTKLGYDPDDKTRARLLTVEDTSGRTLTFTHEEKTFNIPGTAKTTLVITRIEGPGAMSVDFEYDADGNLTQVAREEGARVDTYTYTPDRVVEIPDANAVARLHSKLETHTHANGQTTMYVYGDQVYHTTAVDTMIHLPPDQDDKIRQLKIPLTVPYPYAHVAQIDAPGMGLTQFAYNALARTTTVTNGRGADTTYIMDATGAVIQVDDPAGATRTVWDSEHRRPKQRIDARGVQTDYTYDRNGNLLSESIDGFATTSTYHSLREGLIKNRMASQTDRNGHTTHFTYDSAGNLRTITNAAGGVVQHTYASNGDRLSTRDANGHTTRYDYDPYGNVNTVTAPLGHVTTTQWDIRSRATAITRPGNQFYRYHYDTLNRMIRQTNPMGGTRTWTYDAMGNKLSETDEAGRQTRFDYDAANRLTRITNALGDSRIITYDTQGNKTSERDFRGHLTTFEYDLADRLTRRIEPLNRITIWQYDPVGNPISETDALGRITRFEYDSLGQRIQTTDALVGITTTVYDGEGNLIEQTDANGHTTLFLYDARNQLVERRQPLGRYTTYAHDASGNRTEEIDAHGHRTQWTYDALHRLMRRTNALHHTTVYEYDPAGNLTREINARLNAIEHKYDALNRRTSGTDAEGYRTTYAYDAVGNRIRETRASGNVMEWEYDGLNRPIRQSDNLGTVTRLAYDAEGNRIGVTDANGHTITQVYDALNQLSEKQLPANRTLRFRYDPVGNKIAETDANGHITEFAYDALNRVVTLTDPLNAMTQRDYDAVGNLIHQTDPRGHTIDFDYDTLNQLVATTDALGQTLTVAYDPVGNRVSETDKRGIITTFTYDSVNQLLSTVRAGVTLRMLEYDAVGNVLSETDANGNTTVFVYDRRNLVTRESRPLAAITEHTYDSVGNRIETVDPEGRTTSWTYDERHRQLSETNGDGETTTFEYDGTGNRTRLERPEGNAWTFTYDAANRLTEALDPEQGATTYTYDGNDNRLTQSDAKQQTTTFTYDDLNRLTQLQAVDGTTTTYIYDAAGNRTEEIDANGQLTTHAYDALNRLTRTTYANVLTPTGDDLQQIDYGYDPNDNLLDVTEIYSGTSGVRVTTRSYDDFNRMLTVTDPEGHILTYNYDVVGNRLTLTAPARVTRYVYDALNRVESVITSQGITEYLYDRSGRLIQTKYPTGAAMVTAYDAAGRIETIQHTQQATPVSSYVYAYDANGNRLEERERRGGTELLTTYRYDVVDRLQETAAGSRLTTYTYDAVSNRLSEHRTSLADGSVVVDRSYTYNPRNQLIELRDEFDPTLSMTFGYDANGNRTSQSTSTSTTTYVYDSRNQLRRLTQGGSSLGEFLYDWQGLRVRKQTPAETRHYVYDDQSVLLTTDDTGTLDSHYIYGPGRLLALDHVTQGPQYYLFDALGSVVGLIKPDGSLQSRYAYDAWGNVEDEAGDSENRFGFTGHELDSESGLYYAKARYYDPFVGLFLSEDPLLGDPLTPLSLHRYLYAYQNPLVYIDPDGEESISTLIDQAAEDCGVLGCAGYALLKGLYHVATAGFATVHDPIADARDAGWVTTDQYLKHGVGGGLAVAAVSAVTARSGGALVAGTTSLAGRTATSAAVGALSASAEDAVSQGAFIGSGLQEEFSLSQNLKVAGTGAAIGGTSASVGHIASSRRVHHAQELAVAREGVVQAAKEATQDVGVALAKTASDVLEYPSSPARQSVGQSLFRRAPKSGSILNSLDDLAKLGIRAKRIRPGTNGKVAIMGRGMTQIKQMKEKLKAHNFDVEIFDSQIPRRMLTDFRDAMDLGANAAGLKKLDLFELNRNWAQKVRDEGYTVIDTGDPLGRFFDPHSPGWSVYYTLEKSILFP